MDSNSLFVAPSNGSILKLNVESKASAYLPGHGNSYISALAIDDKEATLFSASHHDSTVAAWSLVSMQSQWAVDVGRDQRISPGCLVYSNGILVVGVHKSRALCLDAKTGSVIRRFEPVADFVTSIAIIQGTRLNQ
jgi:outer membrane protein assembly factor BamB